MALQYEALKRASIDLEQTYDRRDTILYALGVGLGADALDERQLRFVYEKDLVALPTFADVLGYPAMWIEDPAYGLDWARIVHVGQALRVCSPLPVAATVVGRSRVSIVSDKGVGRGALVVLDRTLHDRNGDRLLAQVRMTLMSRADGGFSAVPGNGPRGGDAFRPEPYDAPEGEPDAVIELPTLPQAAIIYRLVADPNPLHVDPKAARAAGFERPILHGMCAYGMAAQALIRRWCDGDPARLSAIALRFSAPVFPGDLLRFKMWRSGQTVRFLATVPGRGAIVLDQGVATII
jgi:acyl dehydratase